MSPKSKKMRIIDEPSFSWKARIVAFGSIFGILWLYLEPQGTFGSSLLSSLGGWGYAGLILLSLLLALLTEYFNRIRLRSHIIFRSFTVIPTESGTRYLVEAPQDMRVEKFLELFLEKVSKRANADNLLSSRKLYEFSLLVRRGGQYISLSSKGTIAEVGLQSGDICTLRGKILPEFMSVRPIIGIPPRFDPKSQHDSPEKDQ